MACVQTLQRSSSNGVSVVAFLRAGSANVTLLVDDLLLDFDRTSWPLVRTSDGGAGNAACCLTGMVFTCQLVENAGPSKLVKALPLGTNCG